jgi:uncharacterized protein YbbC (DUF1343 family)
MVSLGLQEFIKKRDRFKNLKLGLLVHPASVDAHLIHTVDRLLKHGELKIVALFGPQHGIRGETQDNMVEWEGYRCPRTGLPVFSLYGKHRRPTKAMLKNIDALVVDLQDVGARYYTYVWTMALCMEKCADLGKKVIVLDRPNPINGISMEGCMIEPGFASFVGVYPLLMRHGMTVGEVALYLNQEFKLGCDLEVVPMKGWQRTQLFNDTGLSWVMPSPNIPILESAMVYPGMCLFEGTNISEGRGTTRPFEICGAPFIDGSRLASRLEEYELAGVHFRALSFIPAFQKWAGRLCGGVQIHVINPFEFRPVITACRILQAIRELYQDGLQWKKPPYEYESRKMPIDILCGSPRLRLALDRGEDLYDLFEAWEAECSHFSVLRDPYLIYR